MKQDTIETLPIVRPYDINVQGKARPLSRSLENQLLAIVGRRPPYYLEALPIVRADQAPSTLAELLDCSADVVHIESETGAGALELANRPGELVGQRIPVWAGASARTIWSGPRVNYLFRAWHDATHLACAAEFDHDGEMEVARRQCAQIEGKPEKALLWAETAGQVLYHCAHGAFPTDQRVFVAHAVAHGLDRTIARGVYHAA